MSARSASRACEHGCGGIQQPEKGPTKRPDAASAVRIAVLVVSCGF